MLSREGCSVRRNRLFDLLDSECEYVLVSDSVYLVYFADFWVEPNSISRNNLSLLAFNRTESMLFTDTSLNEEAESSWADKVVAVRWYGKEYPVYNRKEAVTESCMDWLRRAGLKSVALEPAATPGNVVQTLSEQNAHIVDITGLLEQMRLQKYPDEVETLRRTILNASHALDAVSVQIRAGMPEWSVFGLLYKEFVSIHQEQASPIGDLITDKRIGGLPRKRNIEKGDLVIMDFSPYSRGYRADIARTLCVGAVPTSTQQEYLDLLLEGLHRAESVLCADVPGREIYETFRKYFHSHGVDQYFTSHAGHGLGLLHPERPFFVPTCNERIPEGAVITLEPGLYNPEIGHIRIEDNYLITASGFEKLSCHGKSLVQDQENNL
jgi:Xaa-Pro aminopeptidase